MSWAGRLFLRVIVVLCGCGLEGRPPDILFEQLSRRNTETLKLLLNRWKSGTLRIVKLTDEQCSEAAVDPYRFLPDMNPAAVAAATPGDRCARCPHRPSSPGRPPRPLAAAHRRRRWSYSFHCGHDHCAAQEAQAEAAVRPETCTQASSPIWPRGQDRRACPSLTTWTRRASASLGWLLSPYARRSRTTT
ncbi:hypothetical protein OH76DRAFT_197062 [Lentinus brumalis]|uniref:TFIIS-type domain-containing protein n=1 Tax=Lentinus brumalis TaxID=2498619 RepID=A0A371DI49_9APHY|nr:hypothetical protein OH76DRAFT_197062 [Polyporus brumalis]